MTSNVPMPCGDGTGRKPASNEPRDHEARVAAVDPERHIVLEASAGTGKTRVLVDRYVNLLRRGVDPRNILAMTFTRKAAAEMRQRIVDELRRAAASSPVDAARWRALRDRLNEIAISTIDAFCLALLREFPLEADLDPGFDVADETDVPRLVEASLDRTLRICRARARTHEEVALLFAQLGEPRLRAGLASLIERRLVASSVLHRVMQRGPRSLTVRQACGRGVQALADIFVTVPGGLEPFLEAGPVRHPRYVALAADIRQIVAAGSPPDDDRTAIDPARLRGMIDRVRAHVFTEGGTPRKVSRAYSAGDYPSTAARGTHWDLVTATAPALDHAIRAWRRNLNAILARAVWHVFGIAIDQYRRTLDTDGVLDFGELLVRARALLGDMDEFARSRYLLEARYHHVLVDEFQDTSRAQWELVSQLIRAWGEGQGLSHEAPLRPSIFIVGDRKQSIYGFRDAEVAVLDEAAAEIGGLRPGEAPLHSISRSFRSAPPLLAFVNDVFLDMPKTGDRPDAFRYDDRDVFPVSDEASETDQDPVLGIAAADHVRACAEAVAAEIARLAAGTVVGDRQTGARRPITPGDVAILFRSRESHRAFERALESRGIPAYVYKGLGFFDADEVKDILALLRYLADPSSDLRAAALLRSRVVRVSDRALHRLAPGLARALTDARLPAAWPVLDREDTVVLERVRASLAGWLDLADRLPPAELLDQVLRETAYAFELKGPGRAQARENVKKVRALVRRIQNRGYLTLARLSEHLDRLSAGDESNAVVDAIDAVNLMTVHAAKGLEFPVVFLVNLARGAGGFPAPIRVSAQAHPDESVAVGDFQTDFDEDARAREREETKRLLYVAMTRARDRLYLASATERGAFRPKPGSLGEVLPASLRHVFTEAAASGGAETSLIWPGPTGRAHRVRVCASTGTAGAHAVSPFGGVRASAPDPLAADEDVAPIVEAHVPARVAVTAIGVEADNAGRDPDGVRDGTRIVVGRLVHRLFQHGARGDEDPGRLVRLGLGLLTDEERDVTPDSGATAAEAADIFARMWTGPEVRTLLESGMPFFEVPISVRLPDAHPGADASILRGVIDCVIERPGGEVVVLDFKTGAPRASDRRQLDAYVYAASALYPGVQVEGRLVYPG